MNNIRVSVTVRPTPKDKDIFEFLITTPVMRTQFVLPRVLVNKLRILIEKALTTKRDG